MVGSFNLTLPLHRAVLQRTGATHARLNYTLTHDGNAHKTLAVEDQRGKRQIRFLLAQFLAQKVSSTRCSDSTDRVKKIFSMVLI
jgi:hypothetical protein